MRALTLLLLCLPAFAQQNIPENQVRDRGQTRPPDESQSWTRGRFGTQQPINAKLQDLSGTLIDASCQDRSTINLQQRPQQPNLAVQPSTGKGAPGVKVDPKTVQRERSDAMAHQTPDVVTRQPDRACSVTGATRGYALLLPNGRLLNLDEGGNTLVTQGMQSIPDGRAMLDGTGPAVKPQVTVRGRVVGDRLVVDKLLKL